MSSLYKRANKTQIRILRAVEGAVKNVKDAHPDWPIEPHMARSIAKRAAGTISSQAGLLAGCKPSQSDSDGVSSVCRPIAEPAHLLKPVPGGAQTSKPLQGPLDGPVALKKGERLSWLRRSPLDVLRADLFINLTYCRATDQLERANVIVDVLKMIDKLRQE